MQSETAISRELMGKIVDEVFDGAIEDTSVIEEIYAVIKREESALSKIDERKPLDIDITQDWFEKRSALEADHEIGAGSRKLTACIDPRPDEFAELFKIAHRIPDGWQLVPVAALSAQVQDVAGWQLVPVEPTAKMHRAAWESFDNGMKPGKDWVACNSSVWRAMLAAAPANQEG